MTTETSIYEYAKAGAMIDPDKVAIWFYGRSITYRELFEKIDNVADHLYELGVREGTVVTIHLPNCPQAVMAIYAVAKLGGICNMVHALTPEAGVRENMVFTKSDMILTYLPECVFQGKKCVFIDVSDCMGLFYKLGFRLTNKRIRTVLQFCKLEVACRQKSRFPEPALLAEKCIAYFHSSGTTGEPKTVMHCHRAINNWVANAKSFFGKNSMHGETLLSVLPLFHGSGFCMDMHQLLSGGGTLVQMARWDSRLAAKWIIKYQINYLTGVPVMYQRLLREPTFDGSSLSQCFVSGDNVGIDLKREFNSRVGKAHCLFEGYGMTETVTACFSCGIRHDNIEASGYPLCDCEVSILSENGIQFTGSGELLVRTNTMMMGYLNDLAATENSYYTDGWLKTGDYGRIDENGYVFFIDRIKNTIIHNGYDIFPAELEKLTSAIEGVREACIVGINDEKTHTQSVKAFITPEEGTDKKLLVERLQKTWNNRLPRFAVPEEICFLAEMPRNQMAKIDRKALENMK